MLAIRETPVFINEDIDAIVAKTSLPHTDLKTNGERVVLFGGSDVSNAEFGLLHELDPHPDHNWTRLLHRNPNDLGAIGAALHVLQVRPSLLNVSTDWDGVPLAD